MAAEKLTKFMSNIFQKQDSKVEILGDFETDDSSLNGLSFNGSYVPEEIILAIFSNLTPQDILKCSLVCKKWYNLAKSNALWQMIYSKREYPKKAKNLPWYIYYCYFATDNFTNLIKNRFGEDGFNHWRIVLNGGDEFIVESPPKGSDDLPQNVPELRGFNSCFATSFHDCAKYQKIYFGKKRLMKYIIKKHKPTLYASEWFAGRFDCGCYYTLTLACDTKNIKSDILPDQELSSFHVPARRRTLQTIPNNQHAKSVSGSVEQFQGRNWTKVEIIYEDYPTDLEALIFYHMGVDNKFWKGHYGSKMAGGVLRFELDSIEPLVEDQDN